MLGLSPHGIRVWGRNTSSLSHAPSSPPGSIPSLETLDQPNLPPSHVRGAQLRLLLRDKDRSAPGRGALGGTSALTKVPRHPHFRLPRPGSSGPGATSRAPADRRPPALPLPSSAPSTRLSAPHSGAPGPGAAPSARIVRPGRSGRPPPARGAAPARGPHRLPHDPGRPQQLVGRPGGRSGARAPPLPAARRGASGSRGSWRSGRDNFSPAAAAAAARPASSPPSPGPASGPAPSPAPGRRPREGTGKRAAAESLRWGSRRAGREVWRGGLGPRICSLPPPRPGSRPGEFCAGTCDPRWSWPLPLAARVVVTPRTPTSGPPLIFCLASWGHLELKVPYN